MNDPWDSPWAATDYETDAKSTTAASPVSPPSRSALKPPPRAFLSTSNSPRVSSFSAPSPWADDSDGFGDWTATADAATQGTTPAFGAVWVGGIVGTEVISSPQIGTPSRGSDEHGHSSYFGSRTSIALPKPVSGGPSIRQPSPDPWSSELSLPLSRQACDGQRTPTFPVETKNPIITIDEAEKTAVAPPEEVWGSETLGFVKGLEMSNEQIDVIRQRGKTARPNTMALETYLTEPTSHIRDIPHSITHNNDLRRLSSESIARSESRLSTQSDTDSERGIERVKSPITSIEDDAKTCGSAHQKASSKVGELVGKFDGSARLVTGDQPARSGERARGKSWSVIRARACADAVGESAGLDGAHEDGYSLCQALSVPAAKPATREAMKAPTLPVIDVAAVEAKFGPIKFEVNLEGMDELFEPATAVAPNRLEGPDADVYKHIITDTFTEISERKVWYRLSRLGSARKHNLGDDDSYRCISWATSTLRIETNKIVRRWLEEDLLGRPSLGGATNRGNMFGWNSAVAPISVEQAFGRKAEAQSRPESLPAPSHRTLALPQAVSPHETMTNASVGSPDQQQRPTSISNKQVASFGWSSDMYPCTEFLSLEPPPSRPAVNSRSTAQVGMRKTPSPVSFEDSKISDSVEATKRGLSRQVEFRGEDDLGEMVSASVGSALPSDLTQGLESAMAPAFIYPSDEATGAAVPNPVGNHGREQLKGIGKTHFVDKDSRATANIPNATYRISSSSSVPALTKQATSGPAWDAKISFWPARGRILSSATATNVGSPISASAKSPGGSPLKTLPSPDRKLMTEQEEPWTPPASDSATSTHFSPTTPLSMTPPLSGATTGKMEAGDFEGTEQAAVDLIVAGLMDLQYMLR